MEELENVSSLKEKVSNYKGRKEGFLLWINNVEEMNDFEELITGTLRHELMSQYDRKLETLLFLEVFSKRINVAFLYILTKQIPLANELIDSAKTLLDTISVKNDTKVEPGIQMKCEGARIALESLKILRDIQEAKVPSSEIELSLEQNPKAIATLKLLEKPFLKAVKVFPEGLELINEAIEIDADWEWFLFKSRGSRGWNKSIGGFLAQSDEIDELEKALELNPRHPRCLVRECEILSIFAVDGPFPITLFNVTYNRKEEVVEYVKPTVQLC